MKMHHATLLSEQTADQGIKRWHLGTNPASLAPGPSPWGYV